jgi:hypothetical protein
VEEELRKYWGELMMTQQQQEYCSSTKFVPAGKPLRYDHMNIALECGSWWRRSSRRKTKEYVAHTDSVAVRYFM